MTEQEESKDRNLHVMELLDLETRRLRNEQTKAGLRNYADLSKDFEKGLKKILAFDDEIIVFQTQIFKTCLFYNR